MIPLNSQHRRHPPMLCPGRNGARRGGEVGWAHEVRVCCAGGSHLVFTRRRGQAGRRSPRTTPRSHRGAGGQVDAPGGAGQGPAAHDAGGDGRADWLLAPACARPDQGAPAVMGGDDGSPPAFTHSLSSTAITSDEGSDGVPCLELTRTPSR